MFELTLSKKKDHTTGEWGWIKRTSDGHTMCRVESWAFTSCGIGALTQLNNAKFSSMDEVSAFFNFVCANIAEDWTPNEFYFLVSDHQLEWGTSIPLMVKHPNVKKRDKFYNKAHGPNWLHLYRYSKDADFPALNSRKQKDTV